MESAVFKINKKTTPNVSNNTIDIINNDNNNINLVSDNVNKTNKPVKLVENIYYFKK